MNNNNNKVLIELIVPEIEQSYSVFLPINKKIGNIIILLNKAIRELSNIPDLFTENNNCLFNQETGYYYNPDNIIKETNIRNGTKLILL